jgi:hypothetical protein
MEVNESDFAVKVFNECGATFHPVTAVHVFDIAEFFYFRTVDVTADHAVGFLVARHLRERFLVFGDELHGGLGLEFQIRRERPVTKPHRAPQPIEVEIKVENPVVKVRTEFFEQVIEVREAVSLVAVDDEIFFPVGGGVHHLARNRDAAEFHAHELLDEFVVVAGNVNHLGLLAAFAEKFLDERVVVLTPEPTELQLPAVNEIADEVKVFAIHHAEKVEELLHARVFGAEVDVRDPN